MTQHRIAAGVRAYYNEIDPDAVLILRALIEDGVIAPGEIDTRSITEVQPDDLDGFTQCHFFAGGGLWSVAARSAGWADDRPLWTASCPCQPFSVAGKGAGSDDARHLWPDLFRLARAQRPAVLVGEQVAGKAGYGWFDGVRADLASEGYASRYVDIPACAVDAPHIRQRGYWVALADANGSGRSGRQEAPQRRPFGRSAAEWPNDVEHAAGNRRSEGRPEPVVWSGRTTVASADASMRTVDDAMRLGDGQSARQISAGRHVAEYAVNPCSSQDVGDAGSIGRSQAFGEPAHGTSQDRQGATDSVERPYRPHGRNGSFWAGADWIICHDQKARRTQPGVPLLVDGIPGRVGLWRVAGNAISPVLAAQVLGALIDTLPTPPVAAGRPS